MRADAAAGNDAGGTEWATSLETGQVVVESHPPLLARTQTPTQNLPGGEPAAATGAGGDNNGGAVVPSGPADTGAALAGENTPGTPNTTIPPVGDPGNGGAAATTPPAAPPAPQDAPAGTSTAGNSAAGARTHVMQRNETFSSIAKAVYGSSRHYIQIEQANPDVNPNAVRPGTVINLPAIDAAPAAAGANSSGGAAAADAQVNSASEYRVQAGDSLYKISTKLYGVSTRVDELYEVNRDQIGEDPARVKVGMVLKLPDAPKISQSR